MKELSPYSYPAIVREDVNDFGKNVRIVEA